MDASRHGFYQEDVMTDLEQLRYPVGRFGQAREVGDAVAWLLSDAASFITGAAIPVDGGFLAGSA